MTYSWASITSDRVCEGFPKPEKNFSSQTISVFLMFKVLHVFTRTVKKTVFNFRQLVDMRQPGFDKVRSPQLHYLQEDLMAYLRSVCLVVNQQGKNKIKLFDWF